MTINCEAEAVTFVDLAAEMDDGEALACVVGLSLALLFAIAAPWDGGLVATGEPIDAVLRDLRTGFFTS